MPAKRNLGPATDTPDSKVQRIEAFESGADFSGPVKERLLKSQRTGQACDRCKIRKIRCDGRPGGCSPCVQNNTECRTTDRITGRATSRGYTEGLEHEVHGLRQTVQALEQQLRDAGIEAKTGSLNDYAPASESTSGPNWTPASNTEQSLWEIGQAMNSAQPYTESVAGSADSRVSESNTYRASLPTFRSGLVGDNYLGVSSSNLLLSSIYGTSLSVFGMGINLNDFIPSELDDGASALSYSEFFTCASKARPEYIHVPLPSYAECRQYAIWYLKSINPFAPILHKPDFIRLIDRIYNEGHEPTVAEDVMVHMMLAILKFQIASRNSDQVALEESNTHYRHSLSHFLALGHGHLIDDLQAIAMISVHMRNFPQPGAAWVVSQIALSVALEMGLHRSSKAWSQSTSKPNLLQVEVKKRVFWSILSIQVNLGGKLGRPMPLRLEDIDIEYPDPMNDNLPDEPQKCSFNLGIQCFKATSVCLQMYSTIYAIRAPNRSYEPSVRKLERELRYLCEQIPAELRDPAQTMNEDVVFAHYVKLWHAEIDLSLHHPALCRSSNKEFMRGNVDHCLRAASAMLHHAYQLHKIRSLDTTWVSVTVYIAAIFTTLFAWAEQISRMDIEDLAKLRVDMSQWLEIIGDSGVFMGSGKQLREALRPIINTTLSSFEQSVAAQPASTASLQLNATPSQDIKHPPEAYSSQSYDTPYNVLSTANNVPQASESNVYHPSISTHPSPLNQHQNHYPVATTTQYAYPEPSSTTITSYPSNSPSTFDPTPYSTSGLPSESDLAHATRIANAAASATSSHANNTPSHVHQHNQPTAHTEPRYQMYHDDSYNEQRHPSHSQMSYLGLDRQSGGGAPAAWRQFAEGVLGQYDPPPPPTHTPTGTDYHQMSAAALMELQGGAAGRGHGGSGGSGMANDDNNNADTGQVVGSVGPAISVSEQQQPIWPLMTYHMGRGGA